MQNAQTQSDNNTFVISRVFETNRDFAFSAWTDPKIMAEWWGPKGFTVSHSKMDLHPGGTYLYGMKSPQGYEMWGKFVFQHIRIPEKLVFINSFSDPQAGITRHPMEPLWPLETMSVITFEEMGDKTRITVEWTPYKATEQEIAKFASSHADMQQGWTGTLDQFAAYLSSKN